MTEEAPRSQPPAPDTAAVEPGTVDAIPPATVSGDADATDQLLAAAAAPALHGIQQLSQQAEGLETGAETSQGGIEEPAIEGVVDALLAQLTAAADPEAPEAALTAAASTVQDTAEASREALETEPVVAAAIVAADQLPEEEAGEPAAAAKAVAADNTADQPRIGVGEVAAAQEPEPAAPEDPATADQLPEAEADMAASPAAEPAVAEEAEAKGAADQLPDETEETGGQAPQTEPAAAAPAATSPAEAAEAEAPPGAEQVEAVAESEQPSEAVEPCTAAAEPSEPEVAAVEAAEQSAADESSAAAALEASSAVEASGAVEEAPRAASPAPTADWLAPALEDQASPPPVADTLEKQAAAAPAEELEDQALSAAESAAAEEPDGQAVAAAETAADGKELEEAAATQAAPEELPASASSDVEGCEPPLAQEAQEHLQPAEGAELPLLEELPAADSMAALPAEQDEPATAELLAELPTEAAVLPAEQAEPATAEAPTEQDGPAAVEPPAELPLELAADAMQPAQLLQEPPPIADASEGCALNCFAALLEGPAAETTACPQKLTADVPAAEAPEEASRYSPMQPAEPAEPEPDMPPIDEQQELQEGSAVPLGATSAMLAGLNLPLGEESYSQLLQREVSAKLLQVLSERELAYEVEADQVEEAAGGDRSSAEVAQPEAAAVAMLPPPPAAKEALEGADQAAANAAAMDAPLPKWSPPTHRRIPHTRRAAPAPAAAGAAPSATVELLQDASARAPAQRRHMAALASPHSLTSPGASHAGVTAGRSRSAGRMPPLSRTAPSSDSPARQRRLSKPSMTEILGMASGQAGRPTRQGGRSNSAGLMTAPPPVALHQAPLQLQGAALPPGAFPTLGLPTTDSAMHWGPRPGPAMAPPLPVPPGWYMPIPPAGPGVMLLQSFMPQPAFGASAAAAIAPGTTPELPMSEPADSPTVVAQLGQAVDGAEGGSSPILPSDGVSAESAAGTFAEEQAPASAEEQAHPYAAAAATTPQAPQMDVATSWPAYDGAKLPPLWEDQVGSAGLIPAVHSAASFSVAAPSRPSHQPAWAQHAPGGGPTPGWRSASLPQQQMAGPYAPLPPGAGPWAGAPLPLQWGPPPPGAPYGGLSEDQRQQQLAMMYQQQAAAAFYYQQQAAAAQYYEQYHHQQALQQQQALAHQQQLAAQQAGGYMHADEPLVARELPPPIPIALDPSGRPFKVFHGVAARGIRRPERYQASDGRPAWTR